MLGQERLHQGMPHAQMIHQSLIGLKFKAAEAAGAQLCAAICVRLAQLLPM
jgi:hypothetical protein